MRERDEDVTNKDRLRQREGGEEIQCNYLEEMFWAGLERLESLYLHILGLPGHALALHDI